MLKTPPTQKSLRAHEQTPLLIIYLALDTQFGIAEGSTVDS
jgi:hypothetical protein